MRDARASSPSEVGTGAGESCLLLLGHRAPHEHQHVVRAYYPGEREVQASVSAL